RYVVPQVPRALASRARRRVTPPLGSALALLPDPDAEHDRRAGEGEVLAETTLDESAVAVLEEAAGEDHEARRAGARLRREEDAGLLAAAQRVRVRRDQLTQEGVQAAGGDA